MNDQYPCPICGEPLLLEREMMDFIILESYLTCNNTHYATGVKHYSSEYEYGSSHLFIAPDHNWDWGYKETTE